MRPFEKEMQRRASSSGSDSDLGLAESFFDGTRSSMFRHVMRDSPWDDPAVIRQAIFSAERLEIHAQSLASAQAIRPHRQKGRPLLDRLADNETSLLLSYQSICGAVAAGAAITPAAEWLIDNFHQVERQIREIRTDLPPSYYRQLPKLADGPFARYPRVFGIAWGFVAHTDSRFDVDSWCSFLRAYQKVQYLTIGELWASAITLRLVLIENLRRIADRIVYSRKERSKADELADRLLGVDGRNAEPSMTIQMELEHTTLSDAFLVQLIHRLRDRGATAESLLTRVDQLLTASGKIAEGSVHDEQERQVAANATVRNIITSMRHMSDVDWSEIFERVNLVDGVLAEGCAFGAMDFPTRNMYRSAIEELARGSKLSELEIARRAVQTGVQTGSEAPELDPRQTDPGYHLCAGGRVKFETAIGFHPRPQSNIGPLLPRARH